MEHHEAVYEQIIEVSNTNQGSDFLSHHLVQEIVVPSDNNQESNMNCEIAGMDIILPNDCITVQDQCNRNVLISYETDGIEPDKQTGHEILHESTRIEHISHVNNIGSNIKYMDNHKEVKVQEYILHDQTSYNQEDYQVTNSVLMSNADTGPTGTLAQAITDNTRASAVSESTLVSTNHVSSDTHDIISTSQIVNMGQESKCAQEQEKDDNQVESHEPVQVDGKVLLADNQVADGNVSVATGSQSQIDSTNEEDNENARNAPASKDSINAEPGKPSESSSPLCPIEESQNSDLVITEAQILTNSDDIAVMTEFNTIEYSAEEEVRAGQEVEQLEEQTLHDEEMQEEAVKSELNESSDAAIAVESMIESKIESSANEQVSYSQSRQEEDEEIDLHLSAQSTDSHRKVIQDIFDDWQDENCEEEQNNQSADAFKDHHQDSVEKELQNLLNDDAQQVQTVSSTNAVENPASSCLVDDVQESGKKSAEKSRSAKLDKRSSESRSPSKTSKSTSSRSWTRDKSHSSSSSKNANQDQDTKKVQPRPGVKVPGSHLTSPIASTAEVAEALNKRLREKQKDLVVPKAADIVFVKKISQRLSNQLSQVVASMPALAAAQQAPVAANDLDKDGKSIEEVATATSKASSVSDNNELLAILEGDDADPDLEWSNLNPAETSSKTSNPNSNASPSGKLDPVMERELALKQLLELPNITTKKSAAGSGAAPKKSNKKTLSKEKESTDLKAQPKEQARSRVIKEEPRPNSTKDGEVISLDSAEEDSPKKTRKTQNENSQNARNSAEIKVEIGIEESRSGRKRKLTEKAREHELAVKRQKVFKNKAAESKKLPQDNKADDEKSEKVRTDSESTNEDKPIEAAAKQVKTDPKNSPPRTETRAAKSKGLPMKKSKLGLLKKNASITKKKLAVKNLLRQKAAGKNAAARPKVPAASSPKKADTPSAKSTSEKTTPTPTGLAHKGKKVSEIDRLLQDEGVVNLLYDVEQPDSRKRLVPITKSQKKVMDVEKAERELKLRTKLVKNAVLRLRNSASATVKISPRSRRSAASDQSAPPQSEKKASDTTKSQKAPSSESTDFVLPAKIRNAADASRIIRRHSSSSFSSASASPRVSIDVPAESATKLDELEALAKSKRKFSHESIDKLEQQKKSKKKAASSKNEPPEDKDDSDKSPSKKATRSNTVAAAKVLPKSKKVPKSRPSSETLWSDVKGAASRDQDELSACLAEAVSALQSSINGGTSRSATASAVNRQSKTQLDDEKLDNRKFSNKEINVRQHGHLVQLILTPSAPVSGIRNAITIPVMNEIREALSILRNDDDCRVVLFTSTGTSFCEGLELSYLQQSNKEERKVRAQDMANAVRDFVRSLAAFNKPIVAGVQGAAIGLGVTMLPLFDLVIASDKATFSTPYSKLGQIAEGAAVLTLSYSLGSAVTNELLLGGRTLTASEALRAGLVTRVLWPDRFQGELLPSLKLMSEQSAQAMEATKALLRHSLRTKLDAALKSESFLLTQHWCSEECQEAIKAYIEEKGQ